MKRLLTILLILISLNGFSQYKSERQIRKENWARIGLFTGSIVLNAVGDGLNDSGNKDIGHLCNALSIGVTLSIPLIIDIDKSNWAWYLLEYTFLRFGIFDTVYNVTRGNEYNYIGTSNFYDQALKGNEDHLMFAKTMFLTVGISINFQEVNR